MAFISNASNLPQIRALLVHSFWLNIQGQPRVGCIASQTIVYCMLLGFFVWSGELSASCQIKNANFGKYVSALISSSISGVGIGWGSEAKLLWGSSFGQIGSLQLCPCFQTCHLHMRCLRFPALHLHNWNMKIWKVAKAICVLTLRKSGPPSQNAAKSHFFQTKQFPELYWQCRLRILLTYCPGSGFQIMSKWSRLALGNDPSTCFQQISPIETLWYLCGVNSAFSQNHLSIISLQNSDVFYGDFSEISLIVISPRCDIIGM